MSSGELNPEERVYVVISMTDACIRVYAEEVRHRDRALTDEEIRERIAYARRQAGGA